MLSINEGIALQNELSKRLAELKNMRSSSLAETSRSYNGETNVSKPVYDAKVIDKKITFIQNWLFKLSSHIKAINAMTRLQIEVPTEELLAPIE